MSTFSGKIQEIPNISVDRFDGENVESEAFFLSHCHSDHMVGLHYPSFRNQLIDNKKYLYASQISCTILKQMYPNIANNLRVLSLITPITIHLKNTSFSVTLIPAGHCPGSVMLLFENGKNILYTGDYRINTSDIKKFKSFYDTYGRVKVIDKLYLDTTFFSKKYLSFPKREESHTQLCEILKKWTEENTCFYINLHTSARYGYEYAFKEIFKKTGMPIHVSSNAFRFYSFVPELDSSVTLDGTKTLIHSHCGEKFGNICIYDKEVKIKKIRMSAMRWTQDTECEPDSGTHYICYSTHASYEEGVALINFLKPKDIEICVEYKNDPNTNNEIINLVRQHLKELQIDLTENVVVPKLFNTEKRRESLDNKDKNTISVLSSPCKNDYWHIKENYSSVEVSPSKDTQNKSVKFDKISSFELSEPVQKCIVDSGFGMSSESLDGAKITNQNFLEIVDSSTTDVKSIKTSPESSNALEKEDNSEDESVLYNIIFTPPESSVRKNVKEVEKSMPDLLSEEEDSVIYSIINSSPPNKRKK